MAINRNALRDNLEELDANGMPLNAIRNNMTGAMTRLQSYAPGSGGGGVALDYSRPMIQLANGKKGYYGKNDPMSVYDAEGNQLSKLYAPGEIQAQQDAEDRSYLRQKRAFESIDAMMKTMDSMPSDTANKLFSSFPNIAAGAPDASSMMKMVQGNIEDIKQKRIQNKAPSGYRYKPDGNMEPIPGGPADLKAQGRFNQDVASMTATEAAMNALAEQANAVKSHKGLDAATGWQSVFPSMPGGDAANAEALLQTLKSKTAFGTLQAMRDASKTGGALGAVSEKELKLLESNLAALDQSQSPEQFKQSLDAIVKYAEEAKARSRGAFNMTHQDRQGMNQQAPSAPSGAPAVGAVVGGYKFLGGNPADQSRWMKVQ